MEPAHIITVCAIAAGAYFLWKYRAPLQLATSSILVQILDAIVVGYVVYLVVESVFDFSAYKTWSGVARVFVFASPPNGVQWFAIFFGLLMGLLRIIADDFTPGSDNRSEYIGGRRLLCHFSALRIANSILAGRADKAKIRRPQHLDPKVSYELPQNEDALDALNAIPNLETNLALTPYESSRSEYKTVLWGMLRIPYELSLLHFLVVGATGSGKTLIIHGLMRSVLPRIKRDKNFRAFIYDDKPDFMPFARQLGLEKYVWSFDPFDANGYAWDIAADVTSTAEAMQVASVLAPLDPGVSDPFWQAGTQAFIGAVLFSFREANGDNWTLRDVVLAFSSEERLREILARDKDVERMARLFLGANSLSDVLAVLQSKLGPYAVPAALYSHAKKRKKKSVREWYETNAILLVTGRSTFTQAVKPINQAIFRMVSLLILNDDEQKPGQSKSTTATSNWIFLDEIREIGRLEGYHELANKGRSKGARLVIGFQSLEGMFVEYGEHAGSEIANLCSHRTFLHTTSVKTREWEAQQVGNVVVDETVFTHSSSVGKDGAWTAGISHSTTRQTRAAMEAADFDQNLKIATPENGLTALNFIPYIGTYVSWVPWAWVTQNLPLPKPRHFGEKLRTGSQQKLKDWQPEDLRRLKLPPTILDDVAPDAGEKDAKEKDTKEKDGGKKKDRRFGASMRKTLEK